MNARQFILFFATAFGLLFLAMSATVIVPYVNHDSVRYFHRAFNYLDPHGDLQYQFVHASGRPLAAELEQFIYYNVNHLSDLSLLRLLSIALFALCAAILALLCVSVGLAPVPALCLSTAVFTLPGVQESVFVPYLFNTLPILVSLSAYMIWQSRLAFGIRFFFTFILLEAAFFTYPSSTFAFLIPAAAAAVYLKADDQTLLRRWGRDVLVWGLAAGFFYVIIKIYYAQMIVQTRHHVDFSLRDVWTFTLSFPSAAVPRIFNLWNVYYSAVLGWAAVAVACLCVALDLFVVKKTWNWTRLAGLSVIFIVVNAIWFLYNGYQPRVFIASQAVALMVLFWCVGWIGEVLGKEHVWTRWLPVLFLLMGLAAANLTVTPNVWNNAEELMFVRTKIVQSMGRRIDKIYVVLKSGDRGFNGLPTVYDNLNGSMDNHEFVDFIRAAIRDLPDKPAMTVDIVCVRDGDPIQITPNTLILNMNDLLRASTLRELNLKIRGNI